MRTLEKTLLPILAAASLAAADTPAPVPDAVRVAAILECPIALATARENLEALSYFIAPGGSVASFETGFKMSEKDSERRLLGSLAVERARQYRVVAAGSGIRFAPRHRETVLATGVFGRRDDEVREYELPLTEAMLGTLKRRNDEVREYELPLTEAMLATLKDMRREVCAGASSAAASMSNANPNPNPNPEIQQYIIDRCKGGDDRACGLLRLR